MRRIRNLCALTILFALFSNFSHAQKAPSFRIEPASISGSAGDTVTVKVITRDFVKVEGLQFTILVDSIAFRTVTTRSQIYSNSHRVIIEGGTNCFNIKSGLVLIGFVSASSDGASIAVSEDSTLFSFRLVLNNLTIDQHVCFDADGPVPMELILANQSNGTFEYPSVSCSKVDFDFEILHFTSRLYDYQFPDNINEITIDAPVSGGKPPYVYDWGNGQSSRSIVVGGLLQLKKDSIIHLKVSDTEGTNVTRDFLLIKYYMSGYITQLFKSTDKKVNVKLKPDFGEPPYAYNWGSGYNMDQDSLEIDNPGKSVSYVVLVRDRYLKIKRFYISLVLEGPPKDTSPMFLGDFYAYNYGIDSKQAEVQVNIYDGFPPYRYVWSNGDTTNRAKYQLRLEENSSEYVVTVTDRKGFTLVARKTAYRDSVLRLRCTTKTLPHQKGEIYFSKNPSSGYINYKIRILLNNVLLKSLEGSTTSSTIALDYTNPSMISNAVVEITYNLTHPLFTIKDTTSLILMNKAPAPQLVVSPNYQLSICKPDKETVLKTGASGGVPPYYYNWGDLGAGLDVTWMAVSPQKSTNYAITITDQVGQSKIATISVKIGEISKINNMTFDKKEICAGVDFDVHIDKSVKIESTNIPLYNLELKTYDHNWNLINSSVSFDGRATLSLNSGEYSNRNNTNLVFKIKSVGSDAYCVDSMGKEIIDSLTVLPMPKFAANNFMADTICEGSILSIFSPAQDSTNLPNVRYEWFMYDTYDNNAIYLDQPLSNYVIRSNYQFLTSSNLYNLHDFIIQGARLTYTNSGCYSVGDYKRTQIVPRPKFLLNNANQLINSNSGVLPIQVMTNLDQVKYALSYMTHNLTGSLLEDQSFPLSGVLVNNTTTSQKLGIIVKGSLYSCEGQVDTAFVEVRNGIEDIYDFTSTDELVTQFKSSARKVADDLGADFQYLLSPNPASSELTFSFGAQSSSSASVGIYSISGQQIMDFPFQTQKGLNAFHCSLDRLPAGSYILLFKSAENVKTERFEKL